MKRRLTGLSLAAVLLTGCASPQVDYSASAAGALQQRVLAVTEAAATGDALSALMRLQELEAAAYDAAAKALISQGRLASILSSIALVRADLEKALSAAELAELHQRLDELDELDDEPSEAPAAPVESPVDAETGSRPTGAEAQDAEKKNAGRAEEQRKNEAEKARKAAEEQRKNEAEKARKAAEEQREAKESARKDQMQAAKKQAEEARKAAKEARGDG